MEYFVWPLSEQASDGEGPITTYGVPGNSDSYAENPNIWDKGLDEAVPGGSAFGDELGLSFPYNNRHGEYPLVAISVQEGGQAADHQPQQGEGVHELEHASNVESDNWDYVVEVWPGDTSGNDPEGLRAIAEHIYQVHAALEKKNLDYHLTVQIPINQEDLYILGVCRRYVLPRRYRNSERSRLKFLQVFNNDRPYNRALDGYYYKMSVIYEGRNPLSLATGPYSPSMNVSADEDIDDNIDDIDNIGNVEGGDNDNNADQQRHPGFNLMNPNRDPTLIPSSTSSRSHSLAPTTPPDRYSSPPINPKASGLKSSHPQPRMKPIPKPQRQVVKNRDGKFICTWNECVAPVKEFSRKCEWSKHMDKHERPYKCNAVGCENIPGFTYSGGLLRHEREVHRKHGGPKNPLYCPHPNCKRHTDSSFARLENLNEHLRRCHTSNGAGPSAQSEEPDNEFPPALPTQSHQNSDSTPLLTIPSPGIGTKRKAAEDELRDENKRLRFENQELRRKIEAGYLQQGAMMEQIDILEKEKESLISRLKEANLMI